MSANVVDSLWFARPLRRATVIGPNLRQQLIDEAVRCVRDRKPGMWRQLQLWTEPGALVPIACIHAVQAEYRRLTMI